MKINIELNINFGWILLKTPNNSNGYNKFYVHINFKISDRFKNTIKYKRFLRIQLKLKRIHIAIYENLEYLEIKQATITIKFRRFNSYTAKGLLKFK